MKQQRLSLIDRLNVYVVGSNDVTAPVIEESYRRFLGLWTRSSNARHLSWVLDLQLLTLASMPNSPNWPSLTHGDKPAGGASVYAWTDVVDDLAVRFA